MANFTTKHYRQLAEFIGDLPTNEVQSVGRPGVMPYAALHYFAFLDSLCEMFQEDNPRFNRETFLKACDAPYFDTVEMGVPCIVEHHEITGEERLVPIGSER
jgi:hypothetical protein